VSVGVAVVVEEMKFASKILRLSLIAALAAATFVTGVWAGVDHPSKPPAVPGERAAGCHGHDGAPPSHSPRSPARLPAPVDYQCCVVGHDAAVVRASYFAQTSAEVSRASAQVEPAPTVSGFSELEVSLFLSAEPPGSAPLRI
jgi:hypothetical protein